MVFVILGTLYLGLLSSKIHDFSTLCNLSAAGVQDWINQRSQSESTICSMEAQHLASRKSSSVHSDHHHNPQGSFTFVVCVLIFTCESINRATYGFYDDLQAFLGLEVNHISS